MTDNAVPAAPDPADLPFHFTSGRLCLDAVASLGARSQERLERWPAPEDLGRWCVEAGLLDVAPAVTTDDLEAARRLREAVYRLVQAAREDLPLPAPDVDLVNGWAARPALAPQLKPQGRERIWRAEAPLEAVLATIARDAVDLLAGDLLGRIRECAEESCTVLFIDSSRPGKRRWCSMSRCGNRVKKQAFRQRQKDTEG